MKNSVALETKRTDEETEEAPGKGSAFAPPVDGSSGGYSRLGMAPADLVADSEGNVNGDPVAVDPAGGGSLRRVDARPDPVANRIAGQAEESGGRAGVSRVDGGRDGGADSGGIAADAEPEAEVKRIHSTAEKRVSARPAKRAAVNAADSQSDYSLRGDNVFSFSDYTSGVNSHRRVVFEKAKWKRSRLRPDSLIARIAGYDIVESEYGVSYLFVISRDPVNGTKKTSADCGVHEHAGFSSWKALETAGRLVKERRQNESKRISGNGTRAS